MLTRTALASDERVLITGASGGVGSAAVQLARRRGAVITALASPDKADGVHALGAAGAPPRDARFDRETFDVVIDVAGGAGFPALLDALKRGAATEWRARFPARSQSSICARSISRT